MSEVFEHFKDEPEINALLSLVHDELGKLPSEKQEVGLISLCAWLFESYAIQKSPHVIDIYINELRKIANSYSHKQPLHQSVQ